MKMIVVWMAWIVVLNIGLILLCIRDERLQKTHTSGRSLNWGGRFARWSSYLRLGSDHTMVAVEKRERKERTFSSRARV
jgi:hypothetical protein